MFERQGYIVVSSRIRRKKGDVLPFLVATDGAGKVGKFSLVMVGNASAAEAEQQATRYGLPKPHSPYFVKVVIAERGR
jgi:hypothetical protein